MVAASIRYNNPGAMWGKGNSVALRWGSTQTVGLNDGLGQGNNIAYFPTKVQGACAQFDLWRTGYCNMSLRNAILKWSGHNWSEPYAQSLVRATGISLETTITPSLLASEQGLRLMVAQARWEAGATYPMTNAEWVQAQKKVFLQTKAPVTVQQKKARATTAVVVVGGAAAGTAVQQGHYWGVVVALVLLTLVGVAIAWFGVHMNHKNTTSPPGANPPGRGPAGGLQPLVPPSNTGTHP